MKYTEALDVMTRTNARLDRALWSNTGKFIFIVAGGTWDFTTDVVGIDALSPVTGVFICERTATNVLQPWSPTPEDNFAEDWRVISDEEKGTGMSKRASAKYLASLEENNNG